MNMSELNREIKGNMLRCIATKLHEKTSLPEWLELLHDQLVGNTEVNSLLFLQQVYKVKNYEKLKSAYFVYLMQENKTIVRSLYGKYDDKVNKQVEDVLDLAIQTHTDGGDMEALRKAAHSTANSAAHSAYSAAYSTANSAHSAYSAAYSAHSAYSAAYSVAYKKHAEKLMELLDVY